MARFDMNINEVDALQKSMEAFGSDALREINDTLHEKGGDEIESEIMKLIPSSGRTWKKKMTAAKNAQPFTQEDGMLSVTVKTVSRYHYLYFPDDGSNTLRHAGNQQFMKRGGENASGSIIDLCVKRLIENF